MAFNFGRDLRYIGGWSHTTATGTTLTTTPVFDLTGFDGVVAFLNGVAVTATGNGLVARGGQTSAALSDLAGTYTTAHTSALCLEIRRPAARFVDFAFRQSSASGQHGALAVFGTTPRVKPTSNAAALTYKLVNSPVTGTATSS